MTCYTDIGTVVAQALLGAVQAVADNRGVTSGGPTDPSRPTMVTVATGTGVPLADACEGMLWTRVANVMPTDGSGAPFALIRWDSAIPAWSVPVEIGVLRCHQNITTDGGWIDTDDEAAYAARDGSWRSVILEAAGYGSWCPDDGSLFADAVLGWNVGPWTPVGPDGGYSGGLVVVTAVCSTLALCPPD